MLDYQDNRWNILHGGYKMPYNPVGEFLKLEKEIEDEQAWDNLWENLHHQGDLGEVSYASVPNLIDVYQRKRIINWNVYALVSTIEFERQRITNPELPNWLKDDYFASLSILFALALDDISRTNDKLTIRCILGFMALYKGLFKYGALISNYDETEIEEIVDEFFSWKEQYK